jgi:hypothetical protein
MSQSTGFLKPNKVSITSRIEQAKRDAIISLGQQHKIDFTAELERLLEIAIPKELLRSIREKLDRERKAGSA